jgi:hypothetical protein
VAVVQTWLETVATLTAVATRTNLVVAVVEMFMVMDLLVVNLCTLMLSSIPLDFLVVQHLLQELST